MPSKGRGWPEIPRYARSQAKDACAEAAQRRIHAAGDEGHIQALGPRKRESWSGFGSAESRAVPSLGSLVIRSYFILAALARKCKKGTGLWPCLRSFFPGLKPKNCPSTFPRP